MDEILIKHEPYVDDRGIWVPINEYTHEALGTAYRCVMTKEMFIEAYNKWIKNDSEYKFSRLVGCRDNDDWWCGD